MKLSTSRKASIIQISYISAIMRSHVFTLFAVVAAVMAAPQPEAVGSGVDNNMVGVMPSNAPLEVRDDGIEQGQQCMLLTRLIGIGLIAYLRTIASRVQKKLHMLCRITSRTVLWVLHGNERST